MAITQEEKKKEKINDIDQSLNLARVQLAEAKFVLGKNDITQTKYLVNRTCDELDDILAKIEEL